MAMEEIKEITKTKWYHTVGFVVTMLITIGPLGLPFLYGSPRFSRLSKVIITVLVIAATIYMTVETIKVTNMILEYYHNAFGIVF
jgi:hypothetical protein